MPATARTELDARTVTRLLVDMGVMAQDVEPSVGSLSGGVANAVLAVSWPGREVVVKQALPKLRVAADWPFDPARTNIERECLGYLARILPRGSVPEVLAFDGDNDVLVISRAPAGGVVWKQALLEGTVEPATGERVGELLGAIHRASAHDETARHLFAELWPLVQGRTNPFHRTVASTRPDLRRAVLAEVERLEATRTTLVLGDFSPKNIIVYPERDPLLLDFEVAHFGDPSFDVAFLLAHLSLKARHRPAAASALRRCASDFLRAHDRAAGPAAPPPAAVVAELGCLLASRIDGKSPVEYLRTDADHESVRTAARALLLDPPASVAEALDLTFAELAPQPVEGR